MCCIHHRLGNCLFKAFYCFNEAALFSVNFSSKPVNTSWTKRFNQENKILFGHLLETQAERRKKLLQKRSDESNTSSDKKQSEERWFNLSLSIPLDKVTDFPLLNQSKEDLKYKNDHVINIGYNETWNNTETVNIPSVTRILQDTMPYASRAALDRWREKMIAELGEETFEKLNKEKLQQGVDFHDSIRQYFLGTSLDKLLSEKQPNIIKLLNSLQSILSKVSNVRVVESQVVHSQLPYKGYIDCVAMYNGEPTLIEWKHSDKKKASLSQTYDAPLQMAAYIGALNYDKHYSFPIKNGMVIFAYTDGSPADVFWLNRETCDGYWKKWLERLHQFIATRATNK